MGEVWRAQDERLRRPAAIKFLPRDVAGDPSRRARFEQEGRALGALNHPNIVTIYDVGEDDGRAYIVSELVDGESLRQLLDRGPVPARKAIDIAVQMAEGIAAAHSLGIVHRDLKPENVMVTRSGQVKLLDFGLAKQSAPEVGEGTATMALSQPGTVMGTAGYMSPEQVRAEPVDARSDIFSLGCVLYEMLSGHSAFHAATGVETMHAILHAEPPDFSGDLKMPPALATIVRRCLEKQPGQRFQSAADLAFALRAITITSFSGVQVPMGIAPAKPSRWKRAVLALFAAILLIGAGFVVRGSLEKRPEVQYQRITFRKGYVIRARFTRDGRNIVYGAVFDNGPQRTYLAIPGNPDSRDLELPEGATLESISSTQQLALNQGGTLSVTSLSGGQTRPLLEGVMAADWSPDGASLAVLRWVNGAVRLEYPIGTVLVEKIVWPQAMLRVSPDGSRVVFATYANGSSIQLIVVDRKGKLTHLGAVSGQNTTGEDSSLCWSPKGDEVWFRSFDTAAEGTVYAVNMAGRRRVALTLPSRVKFYDISPDGQALLTTGSASLGILGAGPGDARERDLSCLDSGLVRAISADGRMIVANIAGESGGAKGAIYLRRMDGTAPVRVADGDAFALSPDAKWISGYVPDSSGNKSFNKRFLLFPTGPGEEVELHAPGLQFTIVVGWLAGDQHYLVEGALSGKKVQCFDWDAARGTIRPLCPETDTEPVVMVSPDRKLILSRGQDEAATVYPADGGPAQPAKGIGSNDDVVCWRDDNRSVYVRPNRNNTQSIPVSIVELPTGKRTPWKEIRPAQPVLEVHDLRIAPGGAYAYTYVVANSDLYIARGL